MKKNRREFIKIAGTAGTGIMATGGINAGNEGIAKQGIKSGGLVAENSKPGTLDWQLQYTRFDDPITLASYPLIRRLRSSSIEGY